MFPLKTLPLLSGQLKKSSFTQQRLHKKNITKLYETFQRAAHESHNEIHNSGLPNLKHRMTQIENNWGTCTAIVGRVRPIYTFTESLLHKLQNESYEAKQQRMIANCRWRRAKATHTSFSARKKNLL